jgi:hypothetical protein
MDPAMRRVAIDKHVQMLYRAERASARIVKEGLTRDNFEQPSLGETAPQARDLPIEVTTPSIASTPTVPSVTSAPQPPAPPIPTYDRFRQQVFQDWTNAFLSFKTNPDREKNLDRLYVENTIARALNLVDEPESTMALQGARDHNRLDAKRLDPEGKRALYESAEFEAIKRDPDQRVRMERLAMAGEILNCSRKIENENGVFFRLQKDLAFALAEPVYAPYVGDEITRYARSDMVSETFFTAKKRDYRHTEQEAAQYDAQQRDLYVDIPVNVFRERLDNLRNTVIDLPTDNDAGADLLREADKRFRAYIKTTDVSMLTEAPGLTLGVIPVGPPGEERAINAMRARRGEPPIKIADNVAKEARAAFLAPESDGSTLTGPNDLLEWSRKKFRPGKDAGLLETSENARDRALALQIPTEAGRVFRFDVGHHSDLKPATVPR